MWWLGGGGVVGGVVGGGDIFSPVTIRGGQQKLSKPKILKEQTFFNVEQFYSFRWGGWLMIIGFY